LTLYNDIKDGNSKAVARYSSDLDTFCVRAQQVDKNYTVNVMTNDANGVHLVVPVTVQVPGIPSVTIRNERNPLMYRKYFNLFLQMHSYVIW
jgi:hypothetical protein